MQRTTATRARDAARNLGRLLALVAAAAPARGSPQGMGHRAEEEPPAPLAPWRVDDLVLRPRISQASLAPDGMALLYVKHVPDPERDRETAQVWLADLPLQIERPLTRGDADSHSPCFNEDGKAIAFLSARKDTAGGGAGTGAPGAAAGGSAAAGGDPKPQVFVLRRDGGEPFPVTSLPEGVAGVQWASKNRLIVAAREAPRHDELERRAAKDKTLVVESERQFASESVRLFEVSLDLHDAPTIRRIGPAAGSVLDFEVAPDGRTVALVAAMTPQHGVDGRVPPRVLLLEVADGRERELFADRRSKPTQLAWSAEGELLYAAGNAPSLDGEEMAGITLAWEVERASGATRPIELAWERGLHDGELVVVNDGFVAALADGVDPRFFRFTRAADGTWSKAPLAGERVDGLTQVIARPGIDTAASHASRAGDPGGWRLAGLVDAELRDERALPLVPSPARGRRLARVETVRFPGAGGDEVEGLLWHPIGPVPAKAPLIVATHGGPHALDVDRFADRWSYPYHLLAERGAFVLAVNYHGSHGYGRAFAESIKGRYYELEVVDLVRGIEHVAARHPVDLDRLACVGWSNGAILSIALTALLPDLVPGCALEFAACVAGAGDVNWTSDYGNCAFGPAFDDYYLGGPPWRAREAYLAKSPLFHVERVTTPTLILFGGADTAVPTAQGHEWYRALQQVGRAPVRFVLMPDEPHALQRLTSRRRKLEEELGFLDRHLFGGVRDEPDARDAERLLALHEGSPLWTAIEARRFARVGDVLGEELAAARRSTAIEGAEADVRAAPIDLPLPEVVDVDGLRLGRFEVTRAQWRAFRPGLPAAPGDEDLPISGVSLADARAYVAWLCERTGARWRLPTIAELEPLVEAAARPTENTLERWAGYAPAPADAAELLDLARARLAEPLRGVPPLLLPCGSCPPLVRGPPAARVALFDLAGNVSEWTLEPGDGDGTPAKARAIGGNALQAPDAGRSRTHPPPEAIGLRVVRD